MSIAAGLVGLPNVGKSTLFNALTNSQVPAENYPFCTIDPHNACTFVPDVRMDKLQAIFKSNKQVPTMVQFVDIAGLVKGAASGEGLGNQFLNHIREVDLILHVVRCFSDADIVYTGSKETINPLEDFDTILTELMLKDLDSVTKRQLKVAQLQKSSKNNVAAAKELEVESHVLKQIEAALNASDVVKVRELAAQLPTKTIDLLSAKNFLIIANVSENDIADDAYVNNPHFQTLVKHFGAEKIIPVCAKLEYELSLLAPEEAAGMAEMMGLKRRGLPMIIERTYQALGLITFFTCGPQEIHAWSIRKGTTVRKAGGEIHSDIERGFICAEVYNTEDLIRLGSEVKVKEAGKMRIEGADYIVKDGDIIHVRFNV